MSEILLSILICSLRDRKPQLNSLLMNLFSQLDNVVGEREDKLVNSIGYKGVVRIEKHCSFSVEIIVATDNKEVTTGEKRNILMSEATGKYTIFSDDDDRLPGYYIEELLKAVESDADCFGITGTMLTNGADEKKWYICLGCPYIARRDENGKEEYVRFPNHITGVKREIANKFPFPPISQGEDFAFAQAMNTAGVLKTEYKIERHPMYIYDYRTNK